MKKVICYVNQFFGGIGGEDKADQEPYIVEGVVGPTMAINAAGIQSRAGLRRSRRSVPIKYRTTKPAIKQAIRAGLSMAIIVF